MAKSQANRNGTERAARPATTGAACACSPGVAPSMSRARDGVGRGAHAVGADPNIKAANLKHLKRIEGQVRGIAAMIEEDRYCADIIQQTAAVQESLRSVAKNLLKHHLRHCAADAMHEQGKKREDMIEEVLSLVGRIAR